MQEIIATGKTVEEAVETACAQLGLTRDDVSIEILEMPQKKLFGMSPAKVKVTAEKIGFNVSDLLAEQEEKPQTSPKPEQPKKAEQHKQPAQKQQQPKQREEVKTETESETEEVVFESLLVPDDQLRELTEEELPVSAVAALAYFRAVAEQMGATQLEYRFYETDRGVKFSIDGEDSSIVIGRRGETMDALQYLCMLVSSRTEGDYCKIMVDVAQYRKKREKTLQALALREANKVKKTKYNQTLEPMNPYERRIVHSAVQNIEGVKSESVGAEPNRRVVISLISGGKGNRRGGGKGNNRGGRSNDRGGDRNNRGPGGRSNDRGGYNKNRDQGSAPPKPKAESSAQSNNNENDGSAVLYGRIDI